MIRPTAYSAVLAVFCTVSMPFPAAAAGRSSRTRLRVDVYNLVHLSERNVRLSAEEAARLMRQAGVDVVWRFPVSEATPKHLAKIGLIKPWDDLGDEGQPFILRILRSTPERLPYALGYSLPAEPDWVHAVIFDDRVEAVHYRNRVAYASLLGCAIAHEVTHMLLKSGQHSIRGVMKARWERSDLLDIACGRLSFNPEEMAPIAQAALRWSTANRRHKPGTVSGD